MANPFHSAGQTVGSTTAGAIVGAIETPYAAVILGGGGGGTDLLTTGDLQATDAGEMGGLFEFAVAFWFQASAFPAATQQIMVGPQTDISSVRQWQFNLAPTGFLSTSVLSAGGFGRGGACGTIRPNTWNFVVLSVEAGSVKSYLNGVLGSTDSAWGSEAVRSMSGVVGQSDVRLVGPTGATTQYFWDELGIYRTPLPAARVLAQYQGGAQRGFPAHRSDQRLTAIIDTVGSHVPCSFTPGQLFMCERYMSGQSPLEEMRRTMECEDVDSALFMTADGTLRFLPWNHRGSAPYNISQATFGDQTGELQYIGYKDAGLSISFVINEWNVTRTPRGPDPPITQTVSDATSIGLNFKRSQSLSDVPVLDEGAATIIANALLAKTKNAMPRVAELNPNMADAATAQAVYRLELMDRITVKRTPPGGGPRIVQDLYVQSIEHSGSPGEPPACTLGVSPL